jgi:hypothetical protein
MKLAISSGCSTNSGMSGWPTVIPSARASSMYSRGHFSAKGAQGRSPLVRAAAFGADGVAAGAQPVGDFVPGFDLAGSVLGQGRGRERNEQQDGKAGHRQDLESANSYKCTPSRPVQASGRSWP